MESKKCRLRHFFSYLNYNDNKKKNKEETVKIKDFLWSLGQVLKMDWTHDLEKKDSLGETPVLYAATNGYENTLARLIAAGAQVNVTNEKGLTPLMKATGRRGLKNVRQLLAAGADVNASSHLGKTALMYAVTSDNKKIMDELIAAGADVNAVDHDGFSPLVHAFYGLREHLADDLLDYGADINQAFDCHYVHKLYSNSYTRRQIEARLDQLNPSSFNKWKKYRLLSLYE